MTAKRDEIGKLVSKTPTNKPIPVTDAAIREKFQNAWDVELPAKSGLTVVEMVHAAEEGSIKALVMMGENPALSDPNLNKTRAALEKVDFLVKGGQVG